ncbi:MAG TPA: hypothetical protein VLY63_24465 [Anaerolineae bacterium]|nr:hypothetical protein [Anaerolineae bacterium]
MTVTYDLARAYQHELLKDAGPGQAAGSARTQARDSILKRLAARLGPHETSPGLRGPVGDVKTTA